MNPSFLRKLLAGVGLGVGAAALVLLLHALGLAETAELKTYDWRVRAVADPASVRQDIVLVEINDTSVRDLAPLAGRWPWPRVVLGDVVDFLSRGGPKVIAVDLTIAEPDASLGFKYGGDVWTGKESDAALADSVRKAGNVVMLADAVYRGVEGGALKSDVTAWTSPPYRLGPAIEERPLIAPPFQALTDASKGLGHNLLNLDEDGPARRIAPFIRVKDKYVPSLGVAAALMGGGFSPDAVVLEDRHIRIGDRRIPLVPIRVRNPDGSWRDRDQLTMLVNYRAPTITDGRRPFTSYEVRHLVLSAEQIGAGQTPMIDPSVFKDKIVFVGLTASGMLDVFNTPFGDSGVMPGIQIHASMADSILSNRFIAPAPDAVRLWATVVFAVLVGLTSAFLPFVGAAAAALLALAGWVSYALHAFRDGLWLNITQPVASIGIALFAGTAYQYFVEGREKRVVKKLFGRYVSKDVYQQLTANPELAELGGKRREMTVLFSDIRGFTTVTEKGDPEELVAQLNEYFSRMVEIVFRHRGTVDKFVGDMVMALFGAPLDDPNHADHGVEAAVTMVKELGELNRKWALEGRAQLDIGIGVNSGEMIAGNIGSSSIMSYTVIGDNVNLGSRLESLNKEYRTRIIISDATRSRLTNPPEIRALGDVTVKGKTRAVAIFEVVVPSPLPAPIEETRI